jgi:hypothetical protein
VVAQAREGRDQARGIAQHRDVATWRSLRFTLESRYDALHLEQDLWGESILTRVNRTRLAPIARRRGCRNGPN